MRTRLLSFLGRPAPLTVPATGSLGITLLVAVAALALPACGGSTASPPRGDHGLIGDSDDAGDTGDAASSVIGSFTDAAGAPVCAMPQGQTGTISAQGDVGFPLLGGGAWTPPPGKAPTYDGGDVDSRDIVIDFSDQKNTCAVGGQYYTGLTVSGQHFLSLDIQVLGDGLPGPGTYTVTNVPDSPSQVTANIGQLTCGDGGTDTMLSASVQTYGQNTVTITEITATEIKGSYSFSNPSAISGTFDVPFCTGPTEYPAHPCCLQ